MTNTYFRNTTERNALIAYLLLVLVLLIACSGPSDQPVQAPRTPASDWAAEQLGPQARPKAAAPLQSPVVLADTAGMPTPNPSRTPGAVSSHSVRTVCAKGYSARSRPTGPQWRALRKQVFTAYGIDPNAKGYQLDHLVPFAIGGASAPANLWPEPLAGPYGAIVKDTVDYGLPLGLLGQLAHRLFVRRDLERVFAYRHEAVERLLG